jgi:hypothetical protein
LKRLYRSKTNVDKLLDGIEKMIDARISILDEEKFACDYRYISDIDKKKYRPAKKMVKTALQQLALQQDLNKNESF